MSVELAQHPITHTHLYDYPHPELGVEVTGEATARYLRFRRPVALERLELAPLCYGRGMPAVPGHPAELVVATLDRQRGVWQTIREFTLACDPRIAGDGLAQSMSNAEMEAHFASVYQDPLHQLELRGITTDALRVMCTREHPHWPNHNECGGNRHIVPFGALNTLKAYGTPIGEESAPIYNPILHIGEIAPVAPRGMRVIDHPMMLLFQGERLSVGFSLHRPLLMHLGWDAYGGSAAETNRLMLSRRRDAHYMLDGFNGPVLRTLSHDLGPCHWSGEVAVHGNQVRYRHLRAIDGLEIDACFTVEPDRLRLELTQRVTEPLPVLEAEAWRLGWNLRAGMTACATAPTLRPGRNGEVALPALWASCEAGALRCTVLQGEAAPAETRLQVESYRPLGCVTGGLVLAPRPAEDGCLLLPAGERRVTTEFVVTPIALATPAGVTPGEGVRRFFPGVLSVFRAEGRGFSNNAASVNVLNSQHVAAELLPYLRPLDGQDNFLQLARLSVERALLDGGGYTYWRNLYLDTDPVLLSAVGRLHVAQPERAWLERVKPGLLTAVARMESHIEDGLLVCRDLTGNSGSFRWSSNAMDCVGFGHLDAYVNAWAYRAFRNAAGLLEELGRYADAERCRTRARELRAAYAPALLNPDTGWVAGWRSRDGALHDYAFTWINGPALAFGLLDAPLARQAMANLEALRDRLGLRDFRLGLPANFLPTRADDHQLSSAELPTFETFTDGAFMGFSSHYYLRALSLYGDAARARRLADEFAEGFALGLQTGGFDTGYEFRTWEGLPTGYEGTLIYSFGALYSIAVAQGAIIPAEPEWWPANG